MKERFRNIPAPLQKQILLRASGIAIGIAIMIFAGKEDIVHLLPGIAALLMFLVSACSLAIQCLDGNYLTILEQYTGLKEKISTQIASGNFPYNQMLQYQEMLYRIDVLETCMAFVKTAPVTMDQRVLSTHYQMLDAFLMCMLQERKIGQPGDETVRKQRETAYTNFQTVVNTFRKQFSSFRPANQDTYRNTIQSMVSTILPAWMSYRNTYVSL